MCYTCMELVCSVSECMSWYRPVHRCVQFKSKYKLEYSRFSFRHDQSMCRAVDQPKPVEVGATGSSQSDSTNQPVEQQISDLSLFLCGDPEEVPKTPEWEIWGQETLEPPGGEEKKRKKKKKWEEEESEEEREFAKKKGRTQVPYISQCVVYIPCRLRSGRLHLSQAISLILYNQVMMTNP